MSNLVDDRYPYVRGYWTTCGDYCVTCAVRRFGWENRRVIRAALRDPHAILPDFLQPIALRHDQLRGFFTVKRRRRWRDAVLWAFNTLDDASAGGGEIDPWTPHSELPRQRVFCEDCGAELDVTPTCIKDDEKHWDGEECECPECDPRDAAEREAT